MRLILGVTLALTMLLAGCGSESADEPAETRVTDPTSSAPAPPDEPSEESPAAESQVIALVSESNVGGEVSPQAVPLDSPVAIADFGARFTDERMGAAISAALAESPVADGRVAMGAVVAIGCDPPTEVEVETDGGRVQITSKPVKSTKQCLVPVTTVALVSVEAGLV